MKLHKLGRGFTLIELLIAVAIIALLTLTVITVLMRNINKANDAKRKADLQKISTAFENYYSDKDCYPDGPILTDCGGSGLADWGLNAIPCDPVFKTPYCYITDADAPNPPACYQKFRVLNTLKYLADPIIKLLGCDSTQNCGWDTECGGSGFNYGVSSTNTNVLNPTIVNPDSPPPPPTPAGGTWGCTPDGDCNNYVYEPSACTHTVSQSDCENGNYCLYPENRCSH